MVVPVGTCVRSAIIKKCLPCVAVSINYAGSCTRNRVEGPQVSAGVDEGTALQVPGHGVPNEGDSGAAGRVTTASWRAAGRRRRRRNPSMPAIRRPGNEVAFGIHALLVRDVIAPLGLGRSEPPLACPG